RPRCPGPLPGVIPGATWRKRPQAAAVASALRFGSRGLASSERPGSARPTLRQPRRLQRGAAGLRPRQSTEAVQGKEHHLGRVLDRERADEIQHEDQFTWGSRNGPQTAQLPSRPGEAESLLWRAPSARTVGITPTLP